MRPILVLGLGNRLMMDDGIGVAVVETLAREHTMDGRATYAIGETDFEYCLDLAAEAEFLIIVDAAMTGKNPGDISVLPLAEVSSRRPGIAQHQAHFLDLLRQLDPPRSGALIGIEPFEIDFHWGLSRALAEQLGAIVGGVRAAVDQLERGLPGCA